MTKIQAQKIVSCWAKHSERNSHALRLYTDSVVALKRGCKRFYVDFGYDNAVQKEKELRKS